jgi:hypothetical protein
VTDENNNNAAAIAALYTSDTSGRIQ